MKRFEGFPAHFEGTAIPNLFFSAVLPQIDDAAELKASLYLFREQYARKGFPRFVRFSELAALESLKRSLDDGHDDYPEVLGAALQLAVDRGTFISLGLSAPGGDDILYMVNTEANREAMQRIADGEIIVDGAQPLVAEIPVGPPPDIFSLYEQNVGELTPIVAEQLTTAEKEYPDGWLADAIREAAELNKRNWRYIQRILENWQAEGKDSGKPGKRVQGTKPGKYTRGRYGHMVRH